MTVSKNIISVIRRQIKFHAKRLKAMPCFVLSDLEDIEQDLFVEIWISLQKYCSEKSHIKTFAEQVMMRRSNNLIQREMCLKRGKNAIFCSIDQEEPEGGTLADLLGGQSPELSYQQSLDIQKILSMLPLELRELCECLKKETISEVALSLGKSRGSIYRDLGQIRHQILEAML